MSASGVATAVEPVNVPEPSPSQWFVPASLFAVAIACLAATAYLGFVPYRPPEFQRSGRFLVGVIGYLAAARAALFVANRVWRSWLFAIVNVGGIAWLLDWSLGRRRQLFLLTTYLAMVCFHYLVMRIAARRGRWIPWVAFFSPIAFLIAIRHAGFLQDIVSTYFPGVHSGPLLGLYVGLSYMTFRLSHLVVEVRNGVVEQPGLGEYLSFAFFVPTFVVGPINPYSLHKTSLDAPSRDVTPLHESLLRIVVGATKYQFFGNIFNQLAYRNLLLDGHPHPAIDLVIAAVAYHLYLYCNFSGFCDMAIGGAGLLGIQVKENFRNPFAARNVQEYWNRWHITLSTWMRDLVFSPLSKYLAVRLGPRNARHGIAVAIAVVFLLVGVWHGVGWHYALFGAAHSIALVIHHYYTFGLKKRLSKAAFQAYNDNTLVSVAGGAITFACTTAFLFLFANDLPTMRKILEAIQF